MQAERTERGELVGRRLELDRLQRSIADAAESRGGVVFVAGEPGIGKTRLVWEALLEAQAAGAQVAWADCVADGPAYWPWRQVLRVAGDGGSSEGLLDPGVGVADDNARFQLFEAIAMRLDAMAVRGPLVIALDDLQWADTPSLRLLSFVARGVHARPVLLLGAYRDVEIGPGHPLADVIGELGGSLSVMTLEGLGPEGVGWLLGQLVAGSSDELASDIVARTGGNPFFVREIAHLLRGPHSAQVGVPAAVGEMARAQYAQCSEACAELVAVAAVASPPLDLGLAARLLDVSPPDLLAPVDEARRRRFLEPSGDGLRFRHDLVREAVLDALPARRRAELHWAIGELLRDIGREDHLEEAARHLRAGAVVGDMGEVVVTVVRAARRASAALAFEMAVDHLEWALDQLHHGLDQPHDLDELELMLQLGDARLQSGDWEQAGTAFEAAAELARTQGRPEDLGRAALGFGAGLGGFEVHLNDARQIALLEEAVAALAGQDSIIGAFVLARLSVALAFVDDPRRRAQLARDAMALADRVGDPAARAHALAAWCDVIAGPAHSAERLSTGQAIVDLGREAANDELALLGHRFRIVALLELGDVVNADREIGAFERLMQRAGLPIARWYVPLWRGMQALVRGDLVAADRLAREAQAMGDAVDSTNATLLAGTLRFHTARAGGKVPHDLANEMRAMVEEYLVRNPSACSAHGVLLVLDLDIGDLDSARAHLRAMVGAGFGEVDAEWLGMMATAVEGCEALGEGDIAAVASDLLAPFEGSFAVDGIGANLVCSVQELLGALDMVTGRRVQGAARLQAAAQQYERMAAPRLATRAFSRLDSQPTHLTAPAERGTLRRDGEGWVFGLREREVRLRDSKGVRDLAVLLSRPGAEVHVAELTGGVTVRAKSSADVLLDQRAVNAYRTRIVELEADIADADSANDFERRAKAEGELDFLVDELSKSMGLGGRARRATSDHERARQAVRARIRYVIDRIAADHPELARHLTASVRTGAFCSYKPERPTTWDVVT